MKTTTLFLQVTAAISLLAAGGGCSGSGSGTGGGGGSTTSAGTGTSTPLPTPDAAWSVTTEQPDGAACPLAAALSLGTLTASVKTTTVAGGDGGAMISCSVLGSGPFEVDAAANNGTVGLEITIPAITATATAAAPAAGTVSLQGAAGGSLYTGSCSVYFVPSTSEAVSSAAVWVAFTCPGLTNSITMATCPVAESYALFENCVSGT